jgi:hypothetical protein
MFRIHHDPVVLSVRSGNEAVEAHRAAIDYFPHRVSDALGRVHVFAQTRFGVIHQWYQQTANGPWSFVPVSPSNAPVYRTHGLGVGKNADGRLEVFYRGAGRAADQACGGFGCNSQVFSVREQSVGGPWGAKTDLFGDHGHGPLAIVQHPTATLQVFGRNYYTGVSGIGETSANGSFYPFQWRDLGGSTTPVPPSTLPERRRWLASASMGSYTCGDSNPSIPQRRSPAGCWSRA